VDPKYLPSVDRFFQFALLGLVASGYLAIAGSGYVDLVTVILAGIGLIWRAAIISGARRLQVPERAVTAATILYMAFAPIDYFLISSTWIIATVHVVFFVASVKTLTARVARDYLFVSAIAFIELLAAALFSASGTFFFCLAAYLLCAVATLSASEVRRLGKADYVIASAGKSRVPWRLASLAAVMTCGILVLTAGLFFLLPRTANAALQFLASNRYHLTGFSNDVTLGEFGELKSDSRPVMHVKPLPTASSEGGSPDLPLNLKWRGLALERFDGHRWSTDPSSFRSLTADRSGLVKVVDDRQRRRAGKRILYRVDIQNVDADALFVAGIPEFLNAGPARISRASSGALRFGYVPGDTVRYEVYSFLEPAGLDQTEHDRQPDRRRISLSASERDQDVKLPPMDPRIGALARSMTEGTQDDRTRAEVIERHLRNDYGYSLELPSTEPRDPIANFLFERRIGYCEYFASAMTVMLRSLNIPTRLVTGFQSGIANPYSGTLVIRASDAHTWVEAFLPDAGWTVFDPTPLAGRVPEQTIWSRFSLYLDAADTFWRDWVLSYDLGQQLTLASRVESRARDFRQNGWVSGLRSVRAAAETFWNSLQNRSVRIAGGWVGGILGGLAFVLWAFKQVQQTLPARKAKAGQLAPADATVLYTRMLMIMKRRGYLKPSWFTAQEFASSVRENKELDPFTAAYYAVRFGGNSSASRDMAKALERLELSK
jgi:transglutaminase-like putative cysteine protease